LIQRDDILSWPRIFPKNVPEQRNGYDCGVFLIVFADYLSKAAQLDFSQEDIDLFRAKIALDFSRMSAL
jgi:sentrin-specific protease 1